LRSPLAFALLVLAAACSDPAPPPSDGGADAGDGGGGGPHGCTTGFVGDEAKAPELVITVLGAVSAAGATPVTDGDTVPLIFPPQGGRVIFAGARARNVAACGATLTGALRDKTTKQVRLDARTVNLIPASDGWVETDATDYSSFSNVPVCPNQWSTTNLYGTVYELEITVADRDGRSVTKTIDVTPTCAEPDNLAECLCICRGGYKLGEVCAADGGTDGGADDAGDGG
jgi:hypothetical protein